LKGLPVSHPPPPPDGGYSGESAGPQKTNPKATWALVTGILGLCCAPIGIAGIVLGKSAQTEIAASGGRQSGEGLAKAGFIIGIISVALWILWVVVSLATGGFSYNFETN